MVTHYVWELKEGYRTRWVIACNESNGIFNVKSATDDAYNVTCSRCRRTKAWLGAMEKVKEEQKGKTVELPNDNRNHVATIHVPGLPGRVDARRIVACVNACAGIPTELLSDMGGKLWELLDIKRTAKYVEWVRKQGGDGDA